jgi:hypothetical protein
MQDKRKPQLHYTERLRRAQRNREIKKNLTEALIVLVTAAVWLALAYVGVTLIVGG